MRKNELNSIIDTIKFEDLISDIRGISTLAFAAMYKVCATGSEPEESDLEAMSFLTNRLNTIADELNDHYLPAIFGLQYSEDEDQTTEEFGKLDIEDADLLNRLIERKSR